MIKNNKNILLMVILIMISITFVYLTMQNNKAISKNEDTDKNIISMYLENEEGSGEYSISENNDFPTTGYYLNEEKSSCENGGELTWDIASKKVKVITNQADKCYIYFDKGIGNFAKYIQSLYTTQGENGIYHHDNTLTNGAEDNSYRYAGPSDEVNNFVCFGSEAEECPNDNLYRIIGVFDDKVKLIKYDYATKNQLGTDGDYKLEGTPNGTYYQGNLNEVSVYYWNYSNGESSTNDWNASRLNTINLNKNYLNYLGEDWVGKIFKDTWYVGGGVTGNIRDSNAKTSYSYELGANKTNNTYNAKVGLMYVSEYYYAASPSYWILPGYNSDATRDYRVAVNDNWMYMGCFDWTISKTTNVSNYVYSTDSNGIMAINRVNIMSDIFTVRPTFSLIPETNIISGTGTKTNPYRLKLT